MFIGGSVPTKIGSPPSTGALKAIGADPTKVKADSQNIMDIRDVQCSLAGVTRRIRSAQNWKSRNHSKDDNPSQPQEGPAALYKIAKQAVTIKVPADAVFPTANQAVPWRKPYDTYLGFRGCFLRFNHRSWDANPPQNIVIQF